MRVVMLSPEGYPYAKTGGLADVLAALPRALAAAGVEVTVCMPGYRSALRAAGALASGTRLYAPIGSRMEPAEMVRVPGASVPTVLMRADRYFDRDGLYGEGGREWPDNDERFAFFCRGALEWLRAEGEPPDVLHRPAWQAPPAPPFADALTTVSPRSAGEIQTPAFGEGLDGVLRARHAALRGILNGIDDAVWNPATDPHLPARYRAGDLAGKARCKRALQAELG